jgi:NAD(P)H-dependent flavin oxidoreductase YrpB (nitropropane dioxygenase family)
MAALATPRLAAAVANAGGLGMVSVYGRTPAAIAATLDEVRTLTTGAVGANFIMHFVEPALAHECVAVAAARVKVVDFFYTQPDAALVEIVHAAGALACWQVGSQAEAVAAVTAGCDFLIAQGIEAGGHVRGTISLLALLGQVLEAVAVPVLAAGGIGTGRALAAVLAAGAAGARVGTRFVAAEEADAHFQYVRALMAATAQDTVYTEAFSNGWLHAPHRCLRACVETAAVLEGEFVGDRPQDGDARQRLPVRRFQPMVISATVSGTIAAMPHWAGESVDGVKWVQTAAEIVHELVGEAEERLQRWR